MMIYEEDTEQRSKVYFTFDLFSEGLKPMERYAVSVRAVYGKRGAGKNTTLYTYTRQGSM